MNDIKTKPQGAVEPASTGSALLEHAQAAFMEWIKIIELELGTAADWYGKTEAALRAGDVSFAYGTAVGKAWGHTENALKLVRDATRLGFEPDSQAPNQQLDGKTD